jgi:hypothetical protein
VTRLPGVRWCAVHDSIVRHDGAACAWDTDHLVGHPPACRLLAVYISEDDTE